MAEEVEEKKAVLTFNGTEYPMEDLNEEQQYLLAQIQDIEAQLKQLSAKEHQAKVAKEGFIELLGKALEPEESTED